MIAVAMMARFLGDFSPRIPARAWERS